MKAGNRVKLKVGNSYQGERGIVVKLNWRDHEQAWVIFDNWLRGEDRRSALSPRWWSVRCFEIIGHEDTNVYVGFQEILLHLRQEAVSSAEASKISETLLEQWGLVLDRHDIEALILVSEEQVKAF